MGDPFFFFPGAEAVAVLSPPPIVTVLMTTMLVPLGARLRTSPPTVTRPPCVRVWPATTRLEIGAEGTPGVMVEKVVGEPVAPAAFTITAPDERETTCPLTVMATPGNKVWDPITNCEFEFSVKVDWPTTTMGAGVGVGEGKVMTSPPAVIAPPGKSVCEPIIKPDSASAVKLLVPITMTPAGELDEVGVGAGLTMMPPAEFSVTTAPPERVMADPPATKV